jgi:hypothetical protein
VRGAPQSGALGRTGAFPPAIPERLVRMFSTVGDTVLDPFAGTWTTLWAAAQWGRNAVGVERDPGTYRALLATARRRGLAPPPRRGRGPGARAPPRSAA